MCHYYYRFAVCCCGCTKCSVRFSCSGRTQTRRFVRQYIDNTAISLMQPISRITTFCTRYNNRITNKKKSVCGAAMGLNWTLFSGLPFCLVYLLKLPLQRWFPSQYIDFCRNNQRIGLFISEPQLAVRKHIFGAILISLHRQIRAHTQTCQF